MVIERGNYFRKTVSLPQGEDIIINGGNYILADIQNEPSQGFTLTVNNGNMRGLKFQGTQLDPDNLPAWIIRNGGAWAYPYTWQRLVPLELAKKLIDNISDRAGPAGREGLALAYTIIKQGAANQTYAQWQTAYAAAAGTSVLLYSNALAEWIQTETAWTWTQIRDWVRARTPAQLAGEDTEVAEEYT